MLPRGLPFPERRNRFFSISTKILVLPPGRDRFEANHGRRLVVTFYRACGFMVWIGTGQLSLTCLPERQRVRRYSPRGESELVRTRTIRTSWFRGFSDMIGSQRRDAAGSRQFPSQVTPQVLLPPFLGGFLCPEQIRTSSRGHKEAVE